MIYNTRFRKKNNILHTQIKKYRNILLSCSRNSKTGTTKGTEYLTFRGDDPPPHSIYVEQKSDHSLFEHDQLVVVLHILLNVFVYKNII